MSTRSRNEEKQYKAYVKALPEGIGCVFCAAYNEELLEETAHFKVIRNAFPYSIWDEQAVDDHLMIIPKQHTDSIASFSDDMVLEAHRLAAAYEKRGYSVYARAPASTVKSVIHQHTHLIKTAGDTRQFIFYASKPYVRIAL